MVSNKLTNRRRTARKPPVCHSGPAVGSILFGPEAIQLKRTPLDQKLPGITSPIVPRMGRCPPPVPSLPPRTCNISPAEFTIILGDGDALDVSACAPALPEGEEIEVGITAQFGEVGSPDADATNCGATASYPYTAPDFETDDVITATITWSDTGICVATALAHIVEEEEE